jgi:hypothetical protein
MILLKILSFFIMGPFLLFKSGLQIVGVGPDPKVATWGVPQEVPCFVKSRLCSTSLNHHARRCSAGLGLGLVMRYF